MTTRLSDRVGAKWPLSWDLSTPSSGTPNRPPPGHSFHRHQLGKDSAQLWGRSTGTHLGAKFDLGHSWYRPGPRFECRQGLPKRGGSVARGLRQALHRGAGTTVGSPGPKQTNGAPHPPRARPSAQRRPRSPVPTPPGGRAESAPGQRRRL